MYSIHILKFVCFCWISAEPAYCVIICIYALPVTHRQKRTFEQGKTSHWTRYAFLLQMTLRQIMTRAQQWLCNLLFWKEFLRESGLCRCSVGGDNTPPELGIIPISAHNYSTVYCLYNMYIYQWQGSKMSSGRCKWTTSGCLLTSHFQVCNSRVRDTAPAYHGKQTQVWKGNLSRQRRHFGASFHAHLSNGCLTMMSFREDCLSFILSSSFL